jgi:transcriptional regulator with XRE-family HTH domain
MSTSGELMHERLKFFFTTNNIKSSFVADSLSISRQQMSNILAGRGNFTYQQLTRFSNLTHINLHWLLTGVGQMMITCTNSLEKAENNDFINDYNKWGSRLSLLQDKNGLSNNDMADIMGVLETQYLTYLLSKKPPKVTELTKLKKNFDVDIDWLLYGKQEESPNLKNISFELLSLSADEILKLKSLLNKLD